MTEMRMRAIGRLRAAFFLLIVGLSPPAFAAAAQHSTEAIGGTDDDAYAGSGNASVVAGTKGVYSQVAQLIAQAISVTQGAIVNATAIANSLNVVGSCIYNATLPTLTEAHYNQPQCDISGLLWAKARIDQTTPGTTNAVAPISGQAGVAGNTGVVGATTQRVTIATDDPVLASANPVLTYRSDSYSNITTSTTTTVKSGAGTLGKICINTKGASSNTATIYDNTAGSGTKIGTLDTTTAVGCQVYDVAFGTGLTLVTATGTAADLTVSYR